MSAGAPAPSRPAGPPRTAVIGADGFLGRAFLAACRRAHPGSVGTTRRAGVAGLAPFDIAVDDARTLRLGAGGHREALILAAVASVGRCERDPAGTRAVNVEGTLRCAEALLEDGVLPVFFSSDYVFDGACGGYREQDPTAPGTEYGRQKAEAERRLLAACGPECRILRLSKVYAIERGGSSLLDRIAERLAGGAGMDAAPDGVFCPTLREDLVAAVALVQRHDLRGVLHVCGPEAWSWYGLATAVAAALDVDPALVRSRPLDEIQREPLRPKNLSMRNERLTGATGCTFTPVAEGIARVAALWRGGR